MSDNRIAIRFYKVERRKPGALQLQEALKAIHALPLTERMKDLLAGDSAGNRFLIRLERLRDDEAPWIHGEFTRVQVDNKPPAAGPHGLKPIQLEEGSGLGHRAAFVYHPETKVIALEVRKNCQISRVLKYLFEHNNLADYRIEPLVTATAWKEFETARPKKFRLRIADPQNLEAIETDDAMPVVDSLKRLASATDAPYITIEASMGNRKGQLHRAMVRRLLEMFGGAGDKSADVRALSVSVMNEDTKATEIVDFLEQILSAEATLPLADDDPEKNYVTRAAWMKAQFSSQLPYISSVYGSE